MPDPAIAHRGEGHLVAHADCEGDVGEVAVGACRRSVLEGDARAPPIMRHGLSASRGHSGCLLTGNKRSAERGVHDGNASAQASRPVPGNRNATKCGPPEASTAGSRVTGLAARHDRLSDLAGVQPTHEVDGDHAAGGDHGTGQPGMCCRDLARREWDRRSTAHRVSVRVTSPGSFGLTNNCPLSVVAGRSF